MCLEQCLLLCKRELLREWITVVPHLLRFELHQPPFLPHETSLAIFSVSLQNVLVFSSGFT